MFLGFYMLIDHHHITHKYSHMHRCAVSENTYAHCHGFRGYWPFHAYLSIVRFYIVKKNIKMNEKGYVLPSPIAQRQSRMRIRPKNEVTAIIHVHDEPLC